MLLIIYVVIFFQILNVEKNCLKVLPESIGRLHLLQTLNLKGMVVTHVCELEDKHQ